MTSNPDVPPFTGYVETTLHALRLIHAARQGVIPRITRRLNDSERRSMIKAGAVFVFSVEESGIKRWTDGLLWSPSRIVGNFLVYREINERTSSRGGHKKPYPLDPQSRSLGTRRNSPDHHLVAFKGPGHLSQTHGSGEHGTFKLNGLIKKTITVTIDGSDLHLISYYTSEDIRSGRLKRPTSRPDIMALSMPPHIFRFTNFRVPPKVEIGPDGKSRLVCETEDLEPTIAVECKLEEPMYHVSDSAQWPHDSDSIHHSPRIDSSFPSSPVYHESHQHGLPSPTMYSREGTTERWPLPLDNLRIVPVSRQDFDNSWSPSPSPTHSQIMPRRRDSDQMPHSSSWSTPHSNSTRWRSDSYTSSTGTASVHPDRSRGRSNTSYDIPSIGSLKRDGDTAPRFGLSSDISCNRNGISQRLPWLPREVSSDQKYVQRSSNSSFQVSSPTIPYSQHQGYARMPNAYGTWPSSDCGSSIDAPLQSHPSLGAYEAPYMSSSPEDFSNTEDYRD